MTHDSNFGNQGEAASRWAGGRYRPLSYVTFALEHALVGNRAWVGHLVNLLLYASVVGVLYLALQDALGPQGGWTLVVATVLFAVHPLHAEVVAPIKGRDDLLELLLALIGLSFAVRAARGASRPRLAWAEALEFATLSDPVASASLR